MVLLIILFVLGCVVGIAWNADIGALLVGICVILFPVFLIVRIIKRVKNSPKRQARREAFERELAVRREKRRRAETILEVTPLGGGSEKYTRYGLKGAVAGGLFFGIPGALIGSVIPKGTKQKQRFLVKYEDGHTEIKEAFTGSDECKKLLKYIK